jgi:hypothetical protein
LEYKRANRFKHRGKMNEAQRKRIEEDEKYRKKGGMI